MSFRIGSPHAPASERFAGWTPCKRPSINYQSWKDSGQPGAIRLGGLHVSGLSPQQAEAFFAYQYLLRADLNPRPDQHLTSIILVTHNQRAYTLKCLESVWFRTDEPYELIVVDNGSTDGSVDDFRTQPDIRLIENAGNRGFPAAVNQGIRAARGRQILLLNNDTVVTTGWLRRMLDALDRDPLIGLVGPVSNCVSGPQQISVDYQSLERLDRFAWEWGQQHAGETFDHDRLVGFCLLIRREVVDRIGLFDEQFGIGNFEDDDYCRRARQAGFRTVIVVDSFVHHFGHRTFLGAGIDLPALMAENQQKYRNKWEPPLSNAPIASPAFTVAEAPEGGLILQPLRPRLSLCMIVRNNENTIRPCLDSIRPWVDELIVVDTGSTDATPRICAELGAQVHHRAWQDDFSAARNESLRHATGDWLFWMDSDDTMPAECGQRLRRLAGGPHAPDRLGYVMQVHCPGPGTNGHRDVTIVDHVKLFRNRPDLRFEHRIHEQILPAIRRAGGDVAFTDIYVVHSGNDHSPEGRRRKLERDFRLLKLELQERPDHPFVLFNLGMTCADCQQFDDARRWLTRCLEVSRPEESHVRKAYALLVSVFYQQHRFSEALNVCQQGRNHFRDDKELLFRQAMLEHQFGNLEEAVGTYRQVLDHPEARHFTSVDADLTGYKARHNLALVYEEQGRFDLAEHEWQEILQVRPNYSAATIGIVQCRRRRHSGVSGDRDQRNASSSAPLAQRP